jgi:hypothetical protein
VQNPAAKNLDMKRTKDIAKTAASRSVEHLVSPDERAAAWLYGDFTIATKPKTHVAKLLTGRARWPPAGSV